MTVLTCAQVMAVDTYSCNGQWNLYSFLSRRAYKNHKESSVGSSCLARVQTVIFVRLPHCGCVDLHGLWPYLLPEIDNQVIQYKCIEAYKKFSLLV